MLRPHGHAQAALLRESLGLRLRLFSAHSPPLSHPPGAVFDYGNARVGFAEAA